MKSFHKILACGLALAMTAGLTACVSEEPSSSGDSSGGGVTPPATSSTTAATSMTTDPNENAGTDEKTENIDTAIYTPSGDAGTVKFLSFYDITTDQKGKEQSKIFQDPNQFNGKIEWVSAPNTVGPFLERLSTLISADDSPDLCEKTVWKNPATVSKNAFEALDEYIDMDSALWKDMKPTIEALAYKGKHYFYPHRLTTSFALNYSQTTIEENNLDDPYELYKAGEWTWDAWRKVMTDFVDKDPEKNIGFFGTDTILTSLIATTGTPLVKVNSDGTIINNVLDPNVSRAMQFYETLYRDGVMYNEQLGGAWVDPADWAKNADIILFEGMEPEWTYTSYANTLQNPSGVDNDVFDTPTDMRFVPFPRDTEADAYYQANDPFGFLVPKGAKNIKGAVELLNCFRVYDADPVMMEKDKQAHINPEVATYTEGKYAGQRRWLITWDETVYDTWIEMRDPTKFTQIQEGAFGLSDDMWTELGGIIADVAFRGESWTAKSAEINPVVDSEIANYTS